MGLMLWWVFDKRGILHCNNIPHSDPGEVNGYEGGLDFASSQRYCYTEGWPMLESVVTFATWSEI